MQCLSYLRYGFIWQHISEKLANINFLNAAFQQQSIGWSITKFSRSELLILQNRINQANCCIQFSLDFVAAAHLRSARLAQSYCTYAIAVRGLFLQQLNSWIGLKTSAWVMSRPWRKPMVLILHYLTSDNISMSDNTFITEIQSYREALSSH